MLKETDPTSPPSARMDLNRKLWQGHSTSSPSPHYARAYQARRYAAYLKRRALVLEKQVRSEAQRLVEGVSPEDRPLSQRLADIHVLEQYNRVILPLLLMATEVEQTAEELRQISFVPLEDARAQVEEVVGERPVV